VIGMMGGKGGRPARELGAREGISHKGHDVLATKFTKVLHFCFVIFVIFVAGLFVPSWPRFSRRERAQP